MLNHVPLCCFLALTAGLMLGGPAAAEEPLRLMEKFPPEQPYHVSSRVELSGSLSPPPAKDQPRPKPITVVGHSAVEYDERILGSEADGKTIKALRIYRQVELKRRMAEVEQESLLRPAVRRLVLVRSPAGKVTFSPDGPLTWGEIDLLGKEVFTPGLAGLLPDHPVRLGDRWAAGVPAVFELTDLLKLEEGGLDCTLEELTTLAGRRHARVSVQGTVRGLNEDGPNRQRLEGFLYYDLESNHLSYLSLHGTHWLLDKDGQEVGKVEGQFVLTRQVNPRVADLADAALRGVALEPDADNTRLLYDNADLGIQLLLPRTWRIRGVEGRQVTVDEAHGNGFLLSVDTPTGVPTAAQFQAEARDFLARQKAKLLTAEAPRRLRTAPREMDGFSQEIEMDGQRALMVYLVLRQEKGGATLAARLMPKDVATLRPELERIAGSIVLTGRTEPRP